ncbi:MAG: aminotransferase class I/II-fold pyridoxal phosphate-dependent enzyme, partial [Alphaproteobacteria bacterium]
ASPGYPAYRNILTGLGVEVIDLPTTLEDNFQPTVARLKALDQDPDGLIVASPSNPAGTMIAPAEFKALVDHCRERGIRLISDEIYHGITYGVPGVTALAHTRDAVVINSFSKYYSMTGWRLGWMVVPKDLHRAIECLAQNLFISPPGISQHAGMAAFDCTEELEANVRHYARNRALLLDKLPKAGFTRLAPAEGAFYIYADVSDLTNNSTEFCRRMLAEVGVAATPGVDFDPTRGDHFVRFSFAGGEDEVSQAADRLVSWQR